MCGQSQLVRVRACAGNNEERSQGLLSLYIIYTRCPSLKDTFVKFGRKHVKDRFGSVSVCVCAHPRKFSGRKYEDIQSVVINVDVDRAFLAGWVEVNGICLCSPDDLCKTKCCQWSFP